LPVLVATENTDLSCDALNDLLEHTLGSFSLSRVHSKGPAHRRIGSKKTSNFSNKTMVGKATSANDLGHFLRIISRCFIWCNILIVN